MFRHIALALTLGAIPLVASPAAAQFIDGQPASTGIPRASAGLGLQIAQPTGDFADYVSIGAGLGGHLRVNLDRQGVFSLRGDFGVVTYGNERTTIPFPGAPRIRVDVNTSNNIVTYTVGPQLTAPAGPVRPYVNGMIGGSYFYTESSMEGTSDNERIFTTENYRDNIFSKGFGGGIYIPLRVERAPVMIDLGARYFVNGKTRYLREGSIRDSGNDIVITPIESETKMLLWHVGVSIGLRGESRSTR